MTYVDGFVIPVPAENKEKFRAHAAAVGQLFKEFGAARLFESWGDDLPEGKVTDFRGSVQAKEDETVAFAWAEYPSKEAREAAVEKMRTDPRMAQFADAPFDGSRMILGSFSSIVDRKRDGETGYADGFIVPVPDGKKQAYLAMAERAAAIFEEYGALRVVEEWGDDVP